MTDLMNCLQPVVIAVNKPLNNRTITHVVINQYWGQALYNRFYNIDKELGFEKFFHCLETIVRQYKRAQMLIALKIFNNITTPRLLHPRHMVPSDSYRHQTKNNFDMLIVQKG